MHFDLGTVSRAKFGELLDAIMQASQKPPPAGQADGGGEKEVYVLCYK